MSYRDRDRRRDRDDYRGGGDRHRGYGGGRDSYGGGRDGYGGGRDSYGGGGYGRDSYGGGRNDRRSGGGGGGGGRRYDGGGGGRKGGRDSGGGGGGGRRFGDGGRDNKRMGGPRNGPPPKRQKPVGNWNEDDRHGLMQSLFMESKPENFEEDWVFVVCPPGKRRLLVAASETTQTYNNAGAEDLTFMSCLPSGSEKKGELDKISDITILDTVYSGEKKMFYIVDLLHWKHYPYYDTESEFRSYVLNDKWAQLKSPEEKTDNNEYPLHLLTRHECTDEKIVEALKAFDSKVEGLLFIKKSAIYKFRESHDCLWLKIDKMEAILGIPTPEGINFAASNAKDEKKVQEQELRRKQYEERLAARQKKEREEEEAEKEKEKETTDEGDNPAAGDAPDEDTSPKDEEMESGDN